MSSRFGVEMDWSSLDNAACYVIKGDGFLINDYGHPDYLRYIEDNRLLTLSYENIDVTAQRGKRFLFFRSYAIQVQIPKSLAWDNGTPLSESEATMVLQRICQTMARYKKRPCHVVVDETVYQRISLAQRARKRAR
jgi:hypothetical protein